MESITSIPTEAAVVAELVKPRIETINGKPFSLSPGHHPALVQAAFDPPAFVSQTVTLLSLASIGQFLDFHGYTEAEDQTPALFADATTSTFTLIFDYHVSCVTPAHAKNRAVFTLPYDSRFLAWKRAFGSWLTQEQFVDLLEENETALHSPPAAEMLSLAANLEIYQNCKVVNRRNAQNGTGEIRFETSEGEQSTKLPEFVTVGVPIYSGLRAEDGKLKAWLIQMRLRYRVQNGVVTFRLAPVKLDDLLDQVWTELVAELRKLPVPVIEAKAP